MPTWSKKRLGGAEGKTINIGARNDAYGDRLCRAVHDAWEELGGEIGEAIVYDIDLPSYDTEADQIVSGNPDGIVIIDFPETYNKVGPALVGRASSIPRRRSSPTGWPQAPCPIAGDDATLGLRGTAPGTPTEGESAEAFDQAVQRPSRRTSIVRRSTRQNFDAVILCYLAAVAAGSTEGADMAAALQDVTGPPGDSYTWEQLPEAIEALQNGDDIDYVGASGEIDLDENGDPPSVSMTSTR